jgi:dihydrofolate reductase
MILSHIVAAAENDVIGADNTLPWDIPEDMKFFRDKTKGKAIIMGRKTFESVGHPLPNRLSVIITRQKDYKVEAPNVVIQPDLKSAIEYCKGQMAKYGEEIFIIGGGEIFRDSMDLVDVIYLTRIHQDFPGDVKYPKVDRDKFELVERRDRNEPVPFSFLTYSRRK